MAVEANEAIVLVIALLGYVAVLRAYMKDKGLKMFLLAYTALLFKTVVTVLEGFVYEDTLNFLEHLVGIGVTGLLFLAAAHLSSNRIAEIVKNVEEKVN